jgi:hypothetical protein
MDSVYWLAFNFAGSGLLGLVGVAWRKARAS